MNVLPARRRRATMPALSLEHVTVRYGGLVAVRDLSLLVDQGEIFGLLGPNGSGKSSTLAVVAGDRLPDEGCVRFAGRRIDEAPLDYRRRLGLVPQELALYDEL